MSHDAVLSNISKFRFFCYYLAVLSSFGAWQTLLAHIQNQVRVICHSLAFYYIILAIFRQKKWTLCTFLCLSWHPKGFEKLYDLDWLLVWWSNMVIALQLSKWKKCRSYVQYHFCSWLLAFVLQPWNVVIMPPPSQALQDRW